MTGQQLKKSLKDHEITGRDLAKLMKKTEETIYVWFGKPSVKKALLKKISDATQIPVDDLTGTANQVSEPETQYGIVHHGEIAFAALKDRGMSVSKFSDLMDESRVTTYKWFEEKEWDEGRLLKASKALQVHVGLLKGKGQGHQSFEKDIYNILQNIQAQLQKNHELLQTLNAK